MRKIPWIVLCILVGIIFLETLIGWLLISSYADEVDIWKSRYNNLQNENRVLKKNIQQYQIDHPDHSNYFPTASPTEVYLIVPEYGSQPTTVPEEPIFEPTKINSTNLQPYKPSDENGMVFDVVGTNKNVQLGKLELEYFLKPAMAGVDICGIANYGTCLPGDPRSHRGGWHQGLDHYPGLCGICCVYGTEIMAIYEGTVVRIDHEYMEMTPDEIGEMYSIMTDIGLNSGRDINYDETYQTYFDKARGRQVVIDHGNGLFSSYCHLSNVRQDLNVGDRVNVGDLIAYLGNSGTSKGAEDSLAGRVIGLEYTDNPSGNTNNMCDREWHLHLELWFSEDGWEDPHLKTKYLNWSTWKKLYGF